MNTQKNTKKTSFIFMIITGVLFGVSLSILANTPKGKELYADVWINIATPVFMLGLYLFIIIKGWKKKTNQQRSLWSALLVLIILLAFFETSHNWQYLPWGRASAFKTSDSFLLNFD